MALAVIVMTCGARYILTERWRHTFVDIVAGEDVCRVVFISGIGLPTLLLVSFL